MAAADTSRGYKGFGSFHAEMSVEDMVASVAKHGSMPVSVHSPQSVLDAIEPFMKASCKQPGTAEFKADNFYIDKNWTFVNHGAFGGAHRLGMQVAAAWREHCETQPLQFVDRQLFAAYTYALWQAAQHVGSSPSHMVFTPNCTTGMNAVLASTDFSTKGVYMLDIGYGSVKKMTQAYAARMRSSTQEGGTCAPAVHMQHVPLPLQEGWQRRLLQEVEETLHAEHTALAVFDHITSNTALVLPVQELVQLCHRKGVPVMIDGAHAWGSTPLDLDSLGADYYVSNGHKWLCCPKGVAFLHVPDPDLRAAVQAPIISHGWDHGFHSSFIWDGCRDYAALLAVPALLQWWGQQGAAAQQHCSSLKEQAVLLLSEAWGTGCMAPLSSYGPMVLLQCPGGVLGGVPVEPQAHAAACTAALDACDTWQDAPVGPYSSEHAKMLQDHLHFQCRVEVPVKCLNGWLYLRVSFAPYNCMEDYEVLRDAINTIVQEGGVQ